MNLKEELLKRIENEVTYEDGFGSKTIKEVIDEVFKEAENKQFVLTDVGCSLVLGGLTVYNNLGKDVINIEIETDMDCGCVDYYLDKTEALKLSNYIINSLKN